MMRWRRTARTPPPSSRRASLPLLLRCALVVLVGAVTLLPRLAEGAASDVLGGSRYEPTTDVGYIVDLALLLNAIGAEADYAEGIELYQKVTPDGISLESLAINNPIPDGPPMYFDSRTNPLYTINMYALWRGPNGSGNGGGSQSRDEMKFLSESVDNYGHTVIMDELDKKSGYDAALTEETIRVTGVWMATVQSLYDAVDLCDQRLGGGTGIDVGGIDGAGIGMVDPTELPQDPTWVNPMDKAAAFWFGDFDDGDSDDVGGKGSLYAWADSIYDKFMFEGTNNYRANAEIEDLLKVLQGDLADCLILDPEEIVDLPENMRADADDMTRAMTVPLVQSLVHRAALAATTDADADAELADYMILYGVLALPPIAICDEKAYGTLYNHTVTNGKEITKDILKDVLNSLYSHLLCLGVTCNQVGTSTVLEASGDDWPTCQNPWVDLGLDTEIEDLLDYLKVDLDVRTIGTLVEMDAATAAYDVYRWGRHSFDQMGEYISLEAIALKGPEEGNSAGESYAAYLSTTDDETFAHKQVYAAMMGEGKFADATLTQRRIVAESGMVTIALNIRAVNEALQAITACFDNEDESVVLHHWERVEASITGWAEQDERADGFLLMGIARYLCEEAGVCVAGEDEGASSTVGSWLSEALQGGLANLRVGKCDNAETRVGHLEKGLLTILVDLNAYFADLLSDDPTDADNLAKSYGAAMALVPLMDDIDPPAAVVVMTNMGSFPDAYDAFSVEDVYATLTTFVAKAGIDCDMLYHLNCDIGDVAVVPTVPSIGVSGPLGGGQYSPTTNVDYIVDLALVLNTIGAEADYAEGIELYQKVTSDGISLESLVLDNYGSNGPPMYLDSRTNPLYSINMYALWRGPNGSGNGGGSQPRNEMEFLNASVDNYGHTVIMDELEKPSGYDPTLTEETIRATGVWMATVQSLYDAVDLCNRALGEGTGIDTVDPTDLPQDPTWANPVDKAAAFWLGDYDAGELDDNGSLYAWAESIRDKFSFGATNPYDVNYVIVKDFKILQTMLGTCLDPTVEAETISDFPAQMRVVADGLTRTMTVPLVQNLVHHAALVVTSEGDAAAEVVDYMILYGLLVLPPIIVCDKNAYGTLYGQTITKGKEITKEILRDVLTSLYSRLLCLGVTCNQVGTSTVLEASGDDWPTCQDPLIGMSGMAGVIDGVTDTGELFLEYLKVDLDVRTIGTLVEMDAATAAYDVYHWGRHSRINGGLEYTSLEAIALEGPEEGNSAAESYTGYFSVKNDETFADQHVYEAMMGKEQFADATPTQRRIIAESGMVTITLHIRAVNEALQAIAMCHDTGTGPTVLARWERVEASLTGWAEQDERADGFLFLGIARYLCEDAGVCVAGEDGGASSTVGSWLSEALQGGLANLRTGDCVNAEKRVGRLEKGLLMILVDLNAYFADLLSDDPTDESNVAESYGAAMALVPLMDDIDPNAADVILTNMGNMGSFPDAYDAFSVEDVNAALTTFVAKAGINCDLLTQLYCDNEEDFDEYYDSMSSSEDEDEYYLSMSSSEDEDEYYVIVGSSEDEDEYYDGMISSEDDYYDSMSSSDFESCRSGVDGGLPSMMNATPSMALLSGAYMPTSNVDHIIKLTENLELIENSTTEIKGIRLYEGKENGVSLQCLSIGAKWNHITTTNPLYVIYMWGLWLSDDGDEDSDGYSNKMFLDEDILQYGDSVIEDELDKNSGFDPELTAETIRMANTWMATTTEMYRAAESCRGGEVDSTPGGFNPVDFAAALWFGPAQDPDSTEGGSLYAWAKKAEMMFATGGDGSNAEIVARLSELQGSFEDCRGLTKDQQETKGIEMRWMAEETTRWMIVPIVQHFIHNLAEESGIAEAQSDERNRMVVYALAVLPLIAVCDERTFQNMFDDLVMDIDSYDSATFTGHIKSLYSRFECLGISCDMVGNSIESDKGWPECKSPTIAKNIAGYVPTSEASFQMLKFDLDINTITSFIIMEASDAALDIYENGRYVNSLENPDSYLSLQAISIPTVSLEVIGIKEEFSSPEVDYASVTRDAIIGQNAFSFSSPLKKSNAAMVAIATIDMHLSILDHMYQAVEICEGADGIWQDHWDSAVAAVVGWTEQLRGDDLDEGVDLYLFSQLAEELCEHFDSCQADGQSIINIKLIAEFKVGQDKLNNQQCVQAKASRDAIERYLQAILIDNLAYHSKIAKDEKHCLMAHVAKNALVPLMRPINPTSADTIEGNITALANLCLVDDVEAVYKALNDYVAAASIDCDLLGSSVCDGTSETVDLESNSEYTPNVDNGDGKYILLNGEYEPLVDVERLHGVSTVVRAICDAENNDVAKNTYLTDESAGMSIQAMSLSAKYAMADELQFNQYIYALKDSVDKTDGSLRFDGSPAANYAHTISNDALATSTILGCTSVKTLNIWMWVVHKLNDAINSCKEALTPITDAGELDEAAALWEGGLLFEMAEELGPKFGHEQSGGMTYLNRMIVDRLKRVRGIVVKSGNTCNYLQVHDLRIIVKETISFMTAVLFQSFIDAMFDDSITRNRQEMVELLSFAVLPHINICGHEAAYKEQYDNMITSGFKEVMIGDTLSVLQSHYNCLGLSCSDVGRHNFANSMHPECAENYDIAGYTPINGTQTNMIAKLDLDAVTIHQMMSMEKSDIAKRIYVEGHNYYDYDSQIEYSFVSLHNLTQSDTIDSPNFEMYDLFDETLGDDYSNSLIINAIDRTGVFQNTTATQRDLAVNIAISSFVSYMSALEALYFSSSECDKGRAVSIRAFDGAVALLVGSAEGRGLGGNINLEGRMFYSMSKRTCDHFRNCKGGNSEVNIELARALKEGQDFAKLGECAELAKAVEAINALLKVPLVQSLLYFSDNIIAMQSDDDAAGYVATMAVYPILKDIDPSSAETIKSTMNFNQMSSVQDNEGVVYSALSEVFSTSRASGIIDCELVTNLDEICSPGKNDGGELGNGTGTEFIEPVKPEEPMPISNGLYVASNYVGDRSAIALDVQGIRDNLKDKDFEKAKDYYDNGQNSKIYNGNGMPTGVLRSISRFSTESNSTMKDEATYNLFVYGLSDKNNEFLGRPATMYADSFISDLLYSESPATPDAMVAVTLWMQVAHSLHSAHRACKMSFLQDGRTTDGRLLQNSDPALFIDEAAAYWIGDNQATGSSTKGHLLYSLTEQIGGRFEEISDGAESNINTQIIDLFNKAKNHIAISRGCSTSQISHLRLLGFVDELISLMAVPLLRHLLYNLETNDALRVKLYAIAVLPLFSACSPSTYLELKDLLIDHDVVQTQKKYILSKIQSMYSCLGLTCDLVGNMETEECDDRLELLSLAGYKYVADQQMVNRAAHIDVDMRKVEIFIENGVRHFPGNEEILFGTAFDLYKYGQHSSDTKDSLSSIAKNTNRDIVPMFGAFRRYFKFDENYADTMIVNAFKKKGVFEQATIDQRKRFIVFALKYVLTYMATLEKLYSSVRLCKEDNRKESALNLDLAAGYFVGSLEGKDDGGNFDGSLIFMLAKRMCVHFKTCTQSHNAVINERIISLFYASQAEIETKACSALEKTVKEIENAMIVPLIQGVLFSAGENENYYKQGFTNLAATEFYPEGFALAQSILPIVDDVDQSSARDIALVMVDGFPGSASDAGSNDSAKVRRAVQNALTKMNKVDCSLIGSIGGNGFCPGDTTDLSSASCSSGSFVSLAVAGVLLLFALY